MGLQASDMKTPFAVALSDTRTVAAKLPIGLSAVPGLPAPHVPTGADLAADGRRHPLLQRRPQPRQLPHPAGALGTHRRCTIAA